MNTIEPLFSEKRKDYQRKELAFVCSTELVLPNQ